MEQNPYYLSLLSSFWLQGQILLLDFFCLFASGLLGDAVEKVILQKSNCFELVQEMGRKSKWMACWKIKQYRNLALRSHLLMQEKRSVKSLEMVLPSPSAIKGSAVEVSLFQIFTPIFRLSESFERTRGRGSATQLGNGAEQISSSGVKWRRGNEDLTLHALGPRGERGSWRFWWSALPPCFVLPWGVFWPPVVFSGGTEWDLF